MDDAESGNHEYLRQFIPSRPTCITAFEYAQSQLPLSLLHHSVRVYLYAKWLAEREKSGWDLDGSKIDQLFIACICHDVGATDNHNGDWRFEVDGADAAEHFARSHGLDEASAHDIWTAVAVHTSPHVAERIHPLARLVRLGVLVEFDLATRDQLKATKYVDEVERDIPRLEIEKVLADAVVKQALHKPHKAPATSWPNRLLKEHLEDSGRQGANPVF